jgi:hypothetical protein
MCTKNVITENYTKLSIKLIILVAELNILAKAVRKIPDSYELNAHLVAMCI